MKSTILLAIAVLGSSVLCYSTARGETRIIGSLNTGELTAPAPAKPLPNFQVQDSKAHRVGARNVTVQKVAPPKPLAAEEEKEPASSLTVQPENNLALNTDNAVSSGLIFLTAKYSEGGGCDLEIWYNGQLTKAWSSIDARCMNGFTEFAANGRRYNIIALPVAGDAKVREDRKENKKGQSKRAKREPASRYFLTEHDGDEKSSRTLLKDLHDLYRVERRALWWAYHERMKNQAKRVAELKANPPKPKDVVIRYWKTPAKK